MAVLRKASTFSFGCHLQIDEKTNNVKEDPRRRKN